MKRPNYGLYGSPAFFIVGALIALASLVAVSADFYRFAIVVLVAALVVVFSIPLIFGSARMRMVEKIVNAAGIKGSALVLDVGTGRGFPAIEIAKRLPSSRVIGIDLWVSGRKAKCIKAGSRAIRRRMRCGMQRSKG